MSPNQTDVGARLAELEATVRGLTQELVDANERIRHLEAALEDEAEGNPGEGATVLAPEHRNGESRREEAGEDSSGPSTKQMSDGRQADEDAGSGTDDIIVA